jgi:hypothetical protein
VCKGVTSIDNGAFEFCAKLAEIIIPPGVTDIGESAFAYCRALRDITIPRGVQTIGSRVFANCSSLTGITIPPGVTEIGTNSFSGCSGIEGITIPDSVVSIGDDVFADCSGLTRINIPKGITSLGFYRTLFIRCTSLTAITVDEAHPAFSSSDGVLYDKTGTILVKYPPGRKDSWYKLPDTVRSVRFSAFSSADNLTAVTIPDRVTLIEAYAFGPCKNLAGIILPTDLPFLEISAFTGTPLEKITIGSNVVLGKLPGFGPVSVIRFADFYNRAGRQGGDYVLRNGEWSLVAAAE